MVADYATTGLTLGAASACAAPARAAGNGHHGRSRASAPQDPGPHRRAGRGPPATRDREGHRVPAARGRVRDDQCDRPAGRLRAPSPDRSHRAAGARARAPREAAGGRRGDQRLVHDLRALSMPTEDAAEVVPLRDAAAADGREAEHERAAAAAGRRGCVGGRPCGWSHGRFPRGGTGGSELCERASAMTEGASRSRSRPAKAIAKVLTVRSRCRRHAITGGPYGPRSRCQRHAMTGGPCESALAVPPTRDDGRSLTASRSCPRRTPGGPGGLAVRGV